MTRLTTRVTRAIDRQDGRWPVVVTLYPDGLLGFRELRIRREYTLPVRTAFRMAIEMDLEAARAARRTRREGDARRGRLATRAAGGRSS